MALHDNPPHTVDTYTCASGTDSGGGVTLTYTVADSAVPCSINTASASTVEMYAQQGMRVSLTVAFLASALTTTLTRGMKLITGDTAKSLHIEGIRQGRAYGSIPAFVYADCSEQL